MEGKEKKKVKVKLERYNRASGREPRYESYEVLVENGETVLSTLQFIRENHDGGLAYYFSCRRGLCGGCVARVNGMPKLLCMEPVQSDMTVEPIVKHKVIKDLVCATGKEVRGSA